MGIVQKVFWWIFWYAIVWFAFICFIGGISEMNVPMPLMAIILFATFIFPGWFATRKVKQKALKKEMEQRMGNVTSPLQTIPQAPPLVPTPSPQITSQPIVQQSSRDIGRNQQVQHVEPVEVGLPSLNTATVDDLMKLSAVNRILAMKIVSQKEKEGDYTSFEDLFARVQLSTQAQEELKRQFSIVPAGDGRFIDF